MKRFLSLCPWLFLFFSGSPAEALLFLLAVILHESGHLLCLSFFRVPLEGFSLSPFGAEIRTGDPYLPYRKEILISLAGPVAGLLSCIPLIFLLRLNFSSLPLYFFFCNFFLSSFNLLPAEGLDGGRALYSFLSLFCEAEQAEKISFIFHVLTVGFCLAAGIFFMTETKNPSLFCIALSLLFGKKKKSHEKSRSFFT